ncbi:MAG: hypothetical protein NTZ05_21120 [Chloroflexi bacterium]|nr:hypothetical protein [Chloroflexota bacterium]
MVAIIPAVPVHLIRRSAQGDPVERMDLTFRFEEDHGEWYGTCLELGTAAQGDSFEEVLEALSEMVELQVTETEKLGFLREYLEERNIRLLPISSRRSAGWELVTAGSRSSG